VQNYLIHGFSMILKFILKIEKAWNRFTARGPGPQPWAY
jgi:hypothetical protein